MSRNSRRVTPSQLLLSSGLKMPNVENNLLKRSPRSRKSLAVGKSANTLSPKRKRAHSIVPGEKIKLAAPRRSILVSSSFACLTKSNTWTETSERNFKTF